MNRIRDLRKKLKLTQCQLAEKINVAQPTLSGYENSTSEPDFDIVTKIADFFNVSIDYLICRDTQSSIIVAKEVKLSEQQKQVIQLTDQLSEVGMTILLGYIAGLLQNITYRRY